MGTKKLIVSRFLCWVGFLRGGSMIPSVKEPRVDKLFVMMKMKLLTGSRLVGP